MLIRAFSKAQTKLGKVRCCGVCLKVGEEVKEKTTL